MWSDFKQSVRGLRRAPLLALLAVLILGFGTGANTAVFSLVSALLFRPFPFPELDQLAYVWERHPQQGRAGRGPLGSRYPMTPADFLDVGRTTASFEVVSALRHQELTLLGSGEPERVRVASTTPGLFRALRVGPARGRLFTEEEGATEPSPVVILSDGLWKRRFAADPSAVGRSVVLDGRAHTIVGVMPRDFAFPLGGIEAWTPLVFDANRRAERSQLSLTVLGRLRDGTTLEGAQAELDGLARRLEEVHPDTNAGRRFVLLRLREEQAGFTAPFAAAFQGSAVFVLLIACLNVGAVLAARAVGRRRELALKAALGAGRWRIARQLLAESAVLSLLGGLFALWIAAVGIDFIRRSVPEEITRWIAGWSAIQLDVRVMAFALAAVVLTAIASAISPVLLAGRLSLDASLREGGRGATPGPRRLLTLVVVGETATALVLLVGAALMIGGFGRLMGIYQGLRPEGVLVTELRLPESRYEGLARVSEFWARALEAARSTPGIEAAAVVSQIPGDLGPVPSGEVDVRGRSAAAGGDRPVVDVQTISPSYFRVLRVPLVRGRALEESDGERTEPVAVVSASMADRLWPAAEALGQEIRLSRGDASAPWRRVVGVVSDVRQYFFDREPRSTVYLPVAQSPRRRMALMARTVSEPATIVGAFRARVATADRELPLGEIRTLADVIDSAMAFLRLAGSLLTALGGVAALLSALGIYGVFAHEVTQRTPEIGVRVALGATRKAILGMVLRRVLRLGVLGLGLGLPAAFALSRVLSSSLFGIVRPDVSIVAALAAGLLSLALLAGYLPARKAASIDAVSALRAE